jgi:hypothetical protein
MTVEHRAMSDREHVEVKTACEPSAGVVCDETRLFPEAPNPRYFGTGSYVSGGPIAEGNYALPDPNPRGGYGCFEDAGGYGSTKLLGEGNSSPACESGEDGPQQGR